MTSHYLLFDFRRSFFECTACGARSLFVHPLYFRDWLTDFRKFASQHKTCAAKETGRAA